MLWHPAGRPWMLAGCGLGPLSPCSFHAVTTADQGTRQVRTQKQWTPAAGWLVDCRTTFCTAYWLPHCVLYCLLAAALRSVLLVGCRTTFCTACWLFWLLHYVRYCLLAAALRSMQLFAMMRLTMINSSAGRDSWLAACIRCSRHVDDEGMQPTCGLASSWQAAGRQLAGPYLSLKLAVRPGMLQWAYPLMVWTMSASARGPGTGRSWLGTAELSNLCADTHCMLVSRGQ